MFTWKEKSLWRRWATAFDSMFETAFYHHGLFCATNPFVVILGASIVGLALSWPSIPLIIGSNPSKYASLQFDIWNTDEEIRFQGPAFSPPSKNHRTLLRPLQLHDCLDSPGLNPARCFDLHSPRTKHLASIPAMDLRLQ